MPARLAHLLRLALAVVDGCAACEARHARAARREGCTGMEIASAMRMCLHEARAELALHYVLAVQAQSPERPQRAGALRRAGFLPAQIAGLDALVAQARYGATATHSPGDPNAVVDAGPAGQAAKFPR